MTQIHKTLGAALTFLTLAASLAAPAHLLADDTAGSSQYRYHIFIRAAADSSWHSIGYETTEADAQATVNKMKDKGLEVFVRKETLQASTTSVAGEWTSDWGPVVFEMKGGGLTGFWQQGEKERGLIKEGAFDPTTRKLVFDYYQDWNNQHGRVEMTLSEDGQTLTGTWKQESGSGGWTMTRKK